MGKEGGPHFPNPQYPHTWVCHMESTLHLSIYFAATYSNFITFHLNSNKYVTYLWGHILHCSTEWISLLVIFRLFWKPKIWTKHQENINNKIYNKQADSVCVIKKKTDQVDKNEGVYTFWKQLLQSKSCTIEGLI